VVSMVPVLRPLSCSVLARISRGWWSITLEHGARK
jgi:hypothetical protein